MPRLQDTNNGILLGAFELDPAAVVLKDGKSTSRIQFAKTGQRFKWYNRTFDLTEDNLDKMVENSKRVATRAPIDYNHLSMTAVVPDQAIAAGWVLSLERDGNKLFGDAEWTPKAAKHIADKEYQYISPVILPNGKDEQGNDVGHVMLSAAITNYPFLKDMQPISLSELQNTGMLLADFSFDEKRSRVYQALTDKFANSFSYVSPVDCFDDFVVFKKDGRLWRMDFALSSKGDVKFKTDPVETLAQYPVALSTPPPVRTPMAEQNDIKNHPDFLALSNQLTALSTTMDTLKAANEAAKTEVAAEKTAREAIQLELNTQKANAAVDALIRAGKVARASKEKMVALYLKDDKFFKEFTDTLPVLLKVDAEAQGDNGDANADALKGKPASERLHEAVVKHIADNGGPAKMGYSDAMRAVTLNDPALAEAYREEFKHDSGESTVN